MAEFQVVDFGPGPVDQTQGYPCEGTEEQCGLWIDAYQQLRDDGTFRYALQMVPDDECRQQPDSRPDHCPFCDCRNLDCGYPQWHAKSLEPCDGENQCELQEWHCMNCGAAFWC